MQRKYKGVTLGLAYIGKDSMAKQDKLNQETVNTVHHTLEKDCLLINDCHIHRRKQVTDKIYALSNTSCPRDALSFINVTKDTASMISKGVLQVNYFHCSTRQQSTLD